MSPHAPRVLAVTVPVDKICAVIGPKGQMINKIQDDTGADITIEDDGTVYIGATDGPSAEAARSAVNAIANPVVPEIGARYLGTVVRVGDLGAFSSPTPIQNVLLDATQLRKLNDGNRVDSVEDVAKVGQKIEVDIREIDARGKISLAVIEDEAEPGDAPAEEPSAE